MTAIPPETKSEMGKQIGWLFWQVKISDYSESAMNVFETGNYVFSTLVLHSAKHNVLNKHLLHESNNWLIYK